MGKEGVLEHTAAADHEVTAMGVRMKTGKLNFEVTLRVTSQDGLEIFGRRIESAVVDTDPSVMGVDALAWYAADAAAKQAVVMLKEKATCPRCGK